MGLVITGFSQSRRWHSGTVTYKPTGSRSAAAGRQLQRECKFLCNQPSGIHPDGFSHGLTTTRGAAEADASPKALHDTIGHVYLVAVNENELLEQLAAAQSAKADDSGEETTFTRPVPPASIGLAIVDSPRPIEASREPTEAGQ